ncbi:putative membrane-bound dehydrogenase-like protein [Saonia flava]|uniref:Putative membrane-bound dehydrogenase-like protein n=1 Tax=Saonia flava TaxID=523696 RepID=A0A846QV57_9FLAO|nr:PVC-type heme-binding CxxCH protein [Saonia flava]NJB72151.1 putative membrane-bound dehydrogenase-like protein [Saonia flava]
MLKNIHPFHIRYMIFFGIPMFLLGCQQPSLDPSPPLSPSDALKSFVLAEEDLQIELVASEPLVQDPVAITFDEGGRLWVVEMLGFMKDIDGTGEKDKIGRISVLFDDDGDGKMDRSTIFIDSLVLPRAIAVVKGGALFAENFPLWYAQDTDGDFVADSKILIDSTYGGIGMPEHSGNGLWRGLDNWYYNAKSKSRYKKINGEWVKDPTEFRGQWGISHDNAGRLFYNYNWSQLHADLVPPNALQNNKNHVPSSGIDHGLTLEREIYPIRSNTAVNRGYVPGTLDDEGKLLEFASACGPLVYRGDAMPNTFLGDAFVCEPTANLIKRNKVFENGFMLSAKGAYDKREFLASTDERFRPISLASGPDGALYVVDMYKGIIQHGPYMTPYLREITLNRKLDKPINMGRIWRITSKEKTPKITPLSSMSSTELVAQLGSPNGWTRDMAQRLLVEQNDPSLFPELEQMVSSGNPLGQLHALWTLEGLKYTHAETYISALSTKDSKVGQAALRLLVNLIPEQPKVKEAIEEYVENNYQNAPPMVQMQMVLASNEMEEEIAFSIIKQFLESYGELPVARDVAMSSLENRESNLLKYLLTEKTWKDYNQNREIFLEMLVTAITRKKSTHEINQLFHTVESSKAESETWVKTAIINGMLNYGRTNDTLKINLADRPNLFRDTNMAGVDNQLQIDNLQNLFTWPGKPEKVETTTSLAHEINENVYATGRQKYLNLCASCHGTQGEGMARFAPPLKQSEWVTGEDYKLTMILLYGMEGTVTVNGKKYDIPEILPSMPSFSTLQNEEIAAIITYIRNSWGHTASEVSSRTVGGIRFRTQGKITPWKESELDTITFDVK